MGIQGNLPAITQGPIDALRSNGSTMAGMGLTMEGQEPGNEIVYDVLLDQAWSTMPLDISAYVKKWVARRYNLKSLSAEVEQAWGILGSTVYNNSNPNAQATIKSIFELAPNADPTKLVGLGGKFPSAHQTCKTLKREFALRPPPYAHFLRHQLDYPCRAPSPGQCLKINPNSPSQLRVCFRRNRPHSPTPRQPLHQPLHEPHRHLERIYHFSSRCLPRRVPFD